MQALAVTHCMDLASGLICGLAAQSMDGAGLTLASIRFGGMRNNSEILCAPKRAAGVLNCSAVCSDVVLELIIAFLKNSMLAILCP